MRTPLRTVLGLALLPGAAAGCGADTSYQSSNRPPAPINVTAAIRPDRVIVSPTRFGAGPIVLIVSNQTGRAQELTIETNEVAGTQVGLRQTSSPINPSGTARLQVDVRRGTYAVHVRDGGVRPAALKVGARRASAQDELLQP